MSLPPRPLQQGRSMKPGEVLLSSRPYHSPMDLIAGQFTLSFPGRVARVRGTHAAQQAAGATAGTAPATYTCRRGFDAASGQVVPLWRALGGFAPACPQ